MTESNTPQPDALIPVLGVMVSFPDPQDLRRELRMRLETAFTVARLAQGEIHAPEDTFDLQRKLAAVRETLEAYGRAFTDAGKQVRGMQHEQLVDAVGEQDGVPNQGLTIPDPEGDVRLSLEQATVREFDLDQIIAVVAERCGATWDDDPKFAERAIRQFLELGKFEPQVTKVKAYAAQVARSGDDRMASVISGAVRDKDPVFKGVKFERKTS